MTFMKGLELLAGLSLVAAGVRMMLQPELYLGSKWGDATDSRTVRQFGIAFLVFGLVILSFDLIKLLSE